jgi:hypothetical protein
MMAMVRDMSKCGVVALALSCALTGLAKAQLLGEPPIPPKNSKKMKRPKSDVEWLWQYSPPPVEGREHDLIQDPHFLPFLQQNFTAPQSFWGLQAEGQRKTLAQTGYDFLTIPGKVIADQNRYITATGSVFHFRSSRGLQRSIGFVTVKRQINRTPSTHSGSFPIACWGQNLRRIPCLRRCSVP